MIAKGDLVTVKPDIPHIFRENDHDHAPQLRTEYFEELAKENQIHEVLFNNNGWVTLYNLSWYAREEWLEVVFSV